MRNKVIAAAAIVVVLAVALVIYVRSHRPQPAGGNQIIFRLGYRVGALADVTPVILNENRDWLPPDVKLELVKVSSPEDALQKFGAGEIDGVAGLTLEAILQRMVERGDPGFRAYYFQVDLQGQGWVSLVASNRVKSVNDLAGKNVASLPTDQARFLVKRILESAGIPDSQIHVVNYNPADPLIGLTTGQQDALFGLEPAISRALNNGSSLLAAGPISEFLFGGKPVPVSASVISKAFIDKYPQFLDKFMPVVDRAIDFQTNHGSQARDYFAKQEYGGIESAVRQRMFFPVMRRPGPDLNSTFDDFVTLLV